MTYEDNPKSIKYYVKRFIHREADRFKGKVVVDFPAGNGVTSKIIQDVGGQAVPFDLFPEYFNIEGLECKRANILEGIPMQDKAADIIICQEGIEHFSDQFKSLKEFNRILKNGGSLIITTPNYSNLRSRMSYFLAESERFNDLMAPNELDSIWMSDQHITKEIYFGHIFLIGIQRLRALCKLAGFRIKHIEKTRVKSTSVLFMILFYPFIYAANWIAYRKNMRKNKDFPIELKKEVYGEIFKLGVSPTTLTDGHLFIEFEKEKDFDEVSESLKSVHKEFGTT